MVGIAVEAALFLGFSLHSVIVSSHEVPPAGPVGLKEVELCRGGPPPSPPSPKYLSYFLFICFHFYLCFSRELAEGLRRRTKSEEENSSGNLAPYQHPWIPR